MNHPITTNPSENDLLAVIAIEQKVFAPFGTNNPAEIVHLQQKTFPAGFIIAKHKNQVIGYASSEKWPDLRMPKIGENPEETHTDTGQVLCITTMVVNEDKRGWGIGTAMLDYLTDLACDSGCHTMIVETPRTRAFYEKNGFVFLEMAEDRGINAAILTKGLVKVT